ncbi:MAG TPA: hypothetical protein VFL42_06780 [Terriglobales bacterium]|nr:hypothetical protein [Terriglobales bacterium]
MFDVPMGSFPGRGTALSLVADGTPESVEWMPVVTWVVSHWLRQSRIAGVLYRDVASCAPVNSLGLGQYNLPHFHGQPLRFGSLFGSHRTGKLLLVVLALPLLPFAKLIFVERRYHQAADEQGQHSKPREKLAKSGIHIGLV